MAKKRPEVDLEKYIVRKSVDEYWRAEEEVSISNNWLILLNSNNNSL